MCVCVYVCANCGMRGAPGITIEACTKRDTCYHADGIEHPIEIGELVMIQHHHKPGKGSELFHKTNALHCVSPKQAETILSGATTGGWPISMSSLVPAQYAVALAILDARAADRPVPQVYKAFRLFGCRECA